MPGAKRRTKTGSYVNSWREPAPGRSPTRDSDSGKTAHEVPFSWSKSKIGGAWPSFSAGGRGGPRGVNGGSGRLGTGQNSCAGAAPAMIAPLSRSWVDP